MAGAVPLSFWHLVAPHRVLLVSLCRCPTVFSCMITHSVVPTVMCLIPVNTAPTAATLISSVLRTASSLAVIIYVATMVPMASIILIWVLRPCSILQVHCLHHCFHLLFQLWIYIFTCCEIYQTEGGFKEHKLGIQNGESDLILLQLWNHRILIKGKSHVWRIFYSFRDRF